MEKSTNYNFNLPNSANDEIADINDISDNFRIIDEKLKIDQTFSETSEKPQSGKAIAEEIGKKQDYFADVSDDSQNRDINLTDKNGTAVGQIVVVPTEGIRYTNVRTPENETDGVNKKYVDDTSNNVKSYVNNNFANALKGSASGEAVKFTDVSPIEHELKIKLKSKNLFNAEAEPVVLIGAEKTLNGTALTFTSTAAMARYVYKIPTETGKQYTVSVKSLTSVPTSGQSATGSDIFLSSTGNPDTLDYGSITSSSLTKTFTAKSDYLYIKQYICYGTNQVGEKKTVDGLQVEEGASATSYEPYISDLTSVTVTRCGKNLLPNPNVHAYNYSTDYKKYNSTDEISLAAGTYSISASANCPTLQFWNKETKQPYTVAEAVSAYSTNTYYKVYDGRALGRSTDSVRNMWFTLKIDALITLNSGYSEATSQECQIELGSTATKYEPYQGQTYAPDTDGTVSGVKSLYPTTTLMTDTEGVIINAEYNRDINKAFAELQQVVLSMGGNI